MSDELRIGVVGYSAQKFDTAVSTAPLPGMGSGSTTLRS